MKETRGIRGARPLFLRASSLETLRAFAIALVILFLLRAFVIDAYRIPSASMVPGLVAGDRILVWKAPYGFIIPLSPWKLGGWTRPRRGDVLVFRSPENPGIDLVKRVVGLPGETVEVRDGVVFIDGRALPREVGSPERLIVRGGEEPRAYKHFIERADGREYAVLYDAEGPGALRDMEPRRVPEGHYFLLGDNRDHSRDGRAWGFADYSRIRGRALVIYLSLGGQGDWRRIGRRVN